MRLQLGLETQQLLTTHGICCGLVYPGFPWQNALIAAIFFLSKMFLKHTFEEWLDVSWGKGCIRNVRSQLALGDLGGEQF